MFISYARADRVLVDEFEKYLKQYAKTFGYFIDRRDIAAGQRFDDKIAEALDRAVFPVLLVSIDFVLSDYIQNVELPHMVRRGLDLPWVLLSPCDVNGVGGVAEHNALHDPNPTIDGPMSLLPPEQRAVRWQSMSAKVRDKVATAPRRARGTDSATRLGELHGVPDPPARYVPRPHDLARLRDAIVGSAAVGITGMKGAGGAGKSVLAASVAASDEVRQRFPDGVFWLTAGQGADPIRLLMQLAKMASVDADFLNELQGHRELKKALTGKRLLVVADDVWEPALAQVLAVTTGESRLVITTRLGAVVDKVHGAPIDVGALSGDEAANYITQIAGSPPPPTVLGPVLELTQGRALGLALVAAAVRHGLAWDEMVDRLRRAPERFVEPDRKAVFNAVWVAWQAIEDPQLRADYLDLAVFPEDAVIPMVTLQRYWGVASLADTRDRVAVLVGRQLVEVHGDAIGLHDEKRSLLLLETDMLEMLHGRLLNAHKPAGGWANLPDDEPYMWDRLAWHLRQSDDAIALEDAVWDPMWLLRRTWRSGVLATEADLNLVPDDRSEPLARRLRQNTNVLAGQPSIEMLANTLTYLLGGLVDTGPLLATSGPLALRPTVPPILPSPALIRTIEGHTNGVSGCAFSPDGTRIASTSHELTVRVWDSVTGRQLTQLDGHTSGVTGCAFSPDGTRIASTSDDQTVRVWDSATGRQLTQLDGHTSWVTGCAFSPDGTRIASTSNDQTVRV